MIITNYANVYYKLLQFPKLWQTRQKLLQITVGITLRRYYKLRRNSYVNYNQGKCIEKK